MQPLHLTECPDCKILKKALYRAIDDWQWEKANTPIQINGRLGYKNVNLRGMMQLVNKMVDDYMTAAKTTTKG